MTWFGCARQSKKNRKQYHIQKKSKFFPEFTAQNILIPLNTLFELEKVGGILAKPAPKKGKTVTTETPHLVTNVYEDDNFGR